MKEEKDHMEALSRSLYPKGEATDDGKLHCNTNRDMGTNILRTGNRPVQTNADVRQVHEQQLDVLATCPNPASIMSISWTWFWPRSQTRPAS